MQTHAVDHQSTLIIRPPNVGIYGYANGVCISAELRASVRHCC